jgi:hypothetical protein
MQNMYYIALDVHKRTISCCVKDDRGTIHAKGAIPPLVLTWTAGMRTLSRPWTAAMEATMELHALCQLDRFPAFRNLSCDPARDRAVYQVAPSTAGVRASHAMNNL